MEKSGLIKAVPYRSVRCAYVLTKKCSGLDVVLRGVASWFWQHIAGTRVMPEFRRKPAKG
jgi:DNA-binding HxlR family transcriptional regulator